MGRQPLGDGLTVEYVHERYPRELGDYAHHLMGLNALAPRPLRRVLPRVPLLTRDEQWEELTTLRQALDALPDTPRDKNGVVQVSHLSTWGGRTTALIRDEQGEVVVSGVANCSPLDRYTKATGRVKALGNALAFLKRQNAAERNAA